MPSGAPIQQPSEIPGKLYFRIREVSELLGLEQHVLRYWETEFPALAPKKTSGGHRLYRRKDVELFLKIKDLLYTRKFTIEGARKALAAALREPAHEQGELFRADPLPEIRRELSEILALFDGAGTGQTRSRTITE
jgi:DNA-binding transcriptional MerR regulator